MPRVRWDPTQYARYSDYRSRSFFDLVAQIGADVPASVVDLGCGTGELTVTLAERWPDAQVRGLDSSPEMIAGAPDSGHVTFAVSAAQEFDATGVDVLVSNAALQWVPEHPQLLASWAGRETGTMPR
jgi:trans-aconitate 2-methyltransferase